MDPAPRTPRAARLARAGVAAALAAVTVACTTTATLAAPPDRGAPPASAAPAAPATATLPPDFPADVPLPPGDVQAATGASGQWSVLLLVSGSAAQAHASVVAFYTGRGFTAETDSILHDAAHKVTIVVENRDHSPTRTFVAIGVTNRTASAPAPAPAPAPGVRLAAALTGHGRGRATLTITGTRACWRFDGLAGVTGLRAASVRRGAAHGGRAVLRLGRRYRRSGCRAIPAALGAAIAVRPQGYRVTVTSRAHPRGAVAGPLGPA